MDAFEVLAAPARRQILAELGRAASSVNGLADVLAANQPAISKHLKVLREAGFVSCRGSAQQRIYQLEPDRFRELDAWLAPYRQLWTRHLDALERYLDQQEDGDESKDYQAGECAKVKLEADGGRWALVFVRELAHPPQKVWSALTDPAALREWSPFDADRDLGSPGAAQLSMAGGPQPEVSKAEVRRAERPHLLEYTWGADVLRWTLEAIPSGTRLTLRHTLDDRGWIPKVAAGWHICLDVAAFYLSGAPIGRIVAAAAREHGWDRLNEAYAQRLDIPNTGFPDEAV